MREGTRGVLAGHMARALRQIKQDLKTVDLVMEVADARAPRATRNPALNRILGRKKRILVLNRADLASEGENARWLAHFRGAGIPAEVVSAATGEGLGRLRSLLVDERIRAEARALVVGVPNVGKSTIINRLAGSAKARTGAMPGVTRGKQWVRVEGFMFLDMPGVLPPLLRGRHAVACLAALGVLGPESCPASEAAEFLIDLMRRRVPRQLEITYQIETEEGDVEYVMTEIGRRRGCLAAGGRVDLERASELVLKDFRRGRLGRVTLEEPPEGETGSGRDETTPVL